MFIKANRFEKIIKTAYKGSRLHVGNDGVNFLASGAGWALSMKEDLMSKELKAVVIKYVGRMPAPEEYFLALEEGDQTEVPGAFIGKVDTRNLPYAEATRLAVIREEALLNIFQAVTENRVFMVLAQLVDLIDESVIDTWDGELRITGPYMDVRNRQIIVQNDRMQLRLFMTVAEDTETELLDYLGKTDLNSYDEEEKA